ncbi:Hypothetical protein D9617_6g093720 [Elsinoe fawcettii]|nr:Hypothetical protein D9617_6g093720 [Elsinoe fawcettii]
MTARELLLPERLPVYLAKYQPSPSQRRHFGIFIPYAAYAETNLGEQRTSVLGCQIHVVGTPMSGFAHEFKRNFNPFDDVEKCEKMVEIGSIEVELCSSPPDGTAAFLREQSPRSKLEREALVVDTPRGGQNPLERVDGVKNRRCQEWTIDYVRHLVKKGWLKDAAVGTVQSERDEPDFGVGLRKVV